MNQFQKLSQLLPVLYPKFYTASDPAGNEFVFLCTDQTSLIPSFQDAVPDRTACEAVENHVHLLDGPIRKRDMPAARRFSTAVAENLFRALTCAYPDKSFFVFLALHTDGAIVRFHQCWPGEPPYYDETASYDAELIVFR